MMGNNSRDALLLCPRHSDISGEQNQPRSRAPLLQCCSEGRHTSSHISSLLMVGTEAEQHRRQLAGARYAQMMRKNIKIPPNYYISTDPRTLPAQVIKNVANSSRDQARRLVMRSASNVTVRRAQYVKLNTGTVKTVKRSSSFCYKYLSVPSDHILAQGLPWEYRKAGIGSCLKGKSSHC